MNPRPVLVSHALWPVRAARSDRHDRKARGFERRDVDLAHKPEWFLDISPLGKTPVLLVDGQRDLRVGGDLRIPRRERAACAASGRPARACAPPRLDGARVERAERDRRALQRAHRDGVRPVRADTARPIRARRDRPRRRPVFAGTRFSLVDAAFAPVLRYFDALDRLGVDVLGGLAKVEAWRAALAQRASVRTAVGSDYGERLLDFIAARPSALGRRAREASPTTT
jgi:glutathione S-transferase